MGGCGQSGSLTADRLHDALKERESVKKIADRSQQLDATAAALQQAVVVAPVAGAVVGRKGEAGQPEPGDELFVIATDAFDFEIPVESTPEVLKRLRPGQAVVIVSNVPNSRYAGTVKRIAKNQAVIGFSSYVAAVQPGMQARVRLQAE